MVAWQKLEKREREGERQEGRPREGVVLKTGWRERKREREKGRGKGLSKRARLS